MLSKTWRAMLAVIPCVSAPLHAESAPDKNDIIVTAERAREDTRRAILATPGGVDLTDAASFADKVAMSLRDALAFSPGVYAQPRFGQEVRLSIRGSGISRGFHMRGLTLLQDGIPINLADDNGDFQELDPQAFDLIEVYRGSNAQRYGSSTLGGAINAITPTGQTSPGLALRIDGGSFDTVRSKAAMGFAAHQGDAYIMLSTDNSDGDRNHARRDAVRFDGNAGLTISDRIQTRFYAAVSHIRQRLPGALTYDDALNVPQLSLTPNITGDQQRDIDSIRLQNRTTIDLGSGTFAFGAFFSAKELFHPIFQVVDQKSRDRGVFAHLELAGTVAGVSIEATLGTSARFGTVAARQYINIGGHRGTQTADTRQKASTINSYGELRIIPASGVSLIAGGVHIYGMRRVDNRLNPQAGGDVSYDRFAPKFGLLWEPRARVQLYANYSRSVELPGFIELTQVQTPPLLGFVDLAPQRAWTAEIGTRGTIGVLHWDITAYRADIRGELLQFSTGLAGGIPASTFNARHTRHQGIEAALDITFAPWARLRQVYQLNDFKFLNDAQYGRNRLPVIPRHQYRAELRLGTDRISVTPSIEWVPHGAWADYANSTRAAGYLSANLGASASLGQKVTLFADIRNITNKHAIGDISAVTKASASSVIYYPIERRAAYAGIRARF